jgi:hypothetical protein
MSAFGTLQAPATMGAARLNLKVPFLVLVTSQPVAVPFPKFIGAELEVFVFLTPFVEPIRVDRQPKKGGFTFGKNDFSKTTNRGVISDASGILDFSVRTFVSNSTPRPLGPSSS